MFTRNQMTRTALMITVALTMSACGQGFKTTASNVDATTAATATDISNELAKAEAANKSAQEAILEANAALATIMDSSGNINLNLFSSSSTSTVQGKGLLSGVLTKLSSVFDKVFERMALVKTKFAEARALLTTAMAKLDANDPTQALLIAEITSKMGAIDKMELTFTTAVHSLASKLDLASAALDKLVSGVTSFIPGFGWVVDFALDYLVMNDVRELIAELKAKLLAF